MLGEIVVGLVTDTQKRGWKDKSGLDHEGVDVYVVVGRSVRKTTGTDNSYRQGEQVVIVGRSVVNERLGNSLEFVRTCRLNPDLVQLIDKAIAAGAVAPLGPHVQ
jgi:hypothetical protein